MDKFHQPVLVNEVISWLILRDEGTYCDCTVGGGGHLLMMLERTKNVHFVGIDWDPEALDFVSKRLGKFKDRVILYEGNFADLDLIINGLKIEKLNGVLFDLGASLHQLTTQHRGFSFNYNGNLLMTMSPKTIPLYKRLQNADSSTIYRVLKEYGDVPHAYRLARLIFENRQHLKTTFDLIKLVKKVTPQRFLKKNLHRVFQAFRIWTNDEFNNLQQGLIKAINLLYPSSRLVVLSYHSGEDRIVKTILRNFEKANQIRCLNKKIIRPLPSEVSTNPSARSARMRVVEKCAFC